MIAPPVSSEMYTRWPPAVRTGAVAGAGGGGGGDGWLQLLATTAFRRKITAVNLRMADLCTAVLPEIRICKPLA
jgi:hypothetical protein